MALIKNTLKKQLSISDDEGAVFINPGEEVTITSARLKELRKNKVVDSYFDLGYLVEGKEPKKTKDQVEPPKVEE